MIMSSKYLNHSYLNASIGFLDAAFQLCRLTVIIAINRAMIPATVKIHQSRVVGKKFSHFSSNDHHRDTS
jgi:hypothetical protein